MAKRRIVSLHWNNVDFRVVQAQAAVFRHFGLAIEQHCRDRMDHGAFLDEIMDDLEPDSAVLIVDIDCVPLNAQIVERAFAFAEAGGIIGCAQVARHIDVMTVYAGPMFFAISRKTWEELGRPSFRSTATGDIAQDLHRAAVKMNRKMEYLYPTRSLIPKWPMADKGFFGIGTFHEGGVFHLYQSRSAKYNWVFLQVCDDVVHDRPTHFAELSRRMMMSHPFPVARGRLKEAVGAVERSARTVLNRLRGRSAPDQSTKSMRG